MKYIEMKQIVGKLKVKNKMNFSKIYLQNIQGKKKIVIIEIYKIGIIFYTFGKRNEHIKYVLNFIVMFINWLYGYYYLINCITN